MSVVDRPFLKPHWDSVYTRVNAAVVAKRIVRIRSLPPVRGSTEARRLFLTASQLHVFEVHRVLSLSRRMCSSFPWGSHWRVAWFPGGPRCSRYDLQAPFQWWQFSLNLPPAPDRQRFLDILFLHSSLQNEVLETSLVFCYLHKLK